MSDLLKLFYETTKRLLVVSRPHLWIYTAGSYLAGVTIGSFQSNPSGFWGEIMLLALWLLVPANIFLYGLNDTFDYETDSKNPRKSGEEIGVLPAERKIILPASIISALLFAPISLIIPFSTQIIVILFMTIALAYNVPPLRLKKRFLAGELYSFTYPLLAIAGYKISSGMWPDWRVVAILGLIGITQHLYASSADINADKNAGMKTTAIFLGWRKTLWVCFLASVLAVFLSLAFGAYLVSITLTAFPVFFWLHLKAGGKFPAYIWYQNLIRLNYVIGFLVTFFMLISIN